MSGDVSLTADIAFPDPKGYGGRKAVLIIRQDLDDDSKEAIVALHGLALYGLGMIHLAKRAEKGVRVKDMEYRIGGRGRPGDESPDSLVNVMAKRIGIEKRRLLCAFRQPGRGAHAPVRAACLTAHRWTFLRRHRLLLSSSRQVRYGCSLERGSRKLGRHGSLTQGPRPARLANLLTYSEAGGAEAILCCGLKKAEVATQNASRNARIAYSRSFRILSILLIQP
jgi:hypothetical protein